MRVVCIGGSAGSLDALREMLPSIAATVPAAFVLVVHLTPTQPSLMAEVLLSYTRLTVHEAMDKTPLTPGTLLVAPPDYHLLVEPEGHVALSRDPPQHFSRPAIDPLFESAAYAVGRRAIGVLLSGANSDGATGLRAIQDAGGLVAVQDPATASSPVMPQAGLAACVPDLVASPDAIGRWLAAMLVDQEQSCERSKAK